jgi:hypothetical protein
VKFSDGQVFSPELAFSTCAEKIILNEKIVVHFEV